jgi:CelD/BcsL family acetyltransferase involved in cellulose biosynthesis
MAEAVSQRAADVPANALHEPAVRVVLHESLDALCALEAPWRALAAQRPQHGPFLDFEWNRAWAELFTGERRRLHVLAIDRGGELLGIAPWVVSEPERARQPRRIRFLGAEHTACDYLDVLCAPHAERSVATALYAHLFGPSAPLWHKLELEGVRADSTFLFHLGECFEQAGKRIEVSAGIFCPTRRLGAEGVTSQLTARRQKKLRYEQGVLERAGPLTHATRHARDSELPAALETFAALYRKRWGGDRDALRCALAYARRAGSESSLRIDLLSLAGRPLAGLLQLQRGDALFLYLTAIDREAFPKLSVGNVLIGMALERAAAEGIERYDFLRGAEDYKLLWSDGAERGLDFTAYRPGVALLAQLAFARARDLVKIAWR